MLIKVRINTPKGYAGSKSFNVNMFKKMLFKKAQVFSEKIDDDGILYEIDVLPRNYNNVLRNLSAFNVMMKSIVNNKAAKKALRRLADTPQDYEELMNLLQNGTSIEVIR